MIIIHLILLVLDTVETSVLSAVRSRYDRGLHIFNRLHFITLFYLSITPEPRSFAAHGSTVYNVRSMNQDPHRSNTAFLAS